MKVAKNAVVSVHYKLTDDDGNQLDASERDQPLVYLHGANNMIAGLEKEMEGRSAGDTFKAAIQPEDAYGEHRPEMMQTVPRDMFQGVDDIQPGMVFQAQAQDGSTHRLTVAAVEGDSIQVDGNHPLAGKVLHFDIEVVGVRAATEEEIAHGHAH